MSSIKYPSGSEWRKWDLHVHTPASILNNGFGDDWDKYVKCLFDYAIENQIACIGLTDYFSIEGYKKVKEDYISSDEKLKELFADQISDDKNFIEKVRSILLLPNIELRLEDVVSTVSVDGKYKNSKLEYHLIINNDLSVQQIEENILGQIKFNNNSSVAFGSDMLPLTKTNIERFGKKLKKDQSEFKGKSDYEVGCRCASINFSSLIDTLKKTSNELYNNCVLVFVEDDITKISWADSAHQIRKNIYANSHLAFSSNPKTIEWGILDTTKDEFTSYKGCIWGSDAHDYVSLFNPSQNRHCWIKADPTFDGLKQTIIHPQQRIYIGAIPPFLDNVEKNKSKYIKELHVSKKNDAKNSENWFDIQLPLNPGLVAIVGNKGSGKSALADIIGYVGHSTAMQYASFLHNTRFQREDKKYAADYTATIKWRDGHVISEDNLYEVENDAIGEYVKYLPQKFIETICGNIDSEFQDEINNVVFSYLDKSVKGDALNLKELIEKECATIYVEIENERNKLNRINQLIVKLEDKKAPKFKKQCEQHLKQLEEEYRRVQNNKPKEVKDPYKIEDAGKAKRILEIDKLIEQIDSEIIENESMLNNTNYCINELKGIADTIDSIENDTNELNERYNIFLNDYTDKNLNPEKPLLALSKNNRELKRFIKEFELQKEQINTKLKPVLVDIQWDNEEAVERMQDSLEESLYFKKAKLFNEKEKLVMESSSEQQLYEKYRSDLKDWEDSLEKIKGDNKTEGSINYYKSLLTHIDEELVRELANADNKRNKCLRSIYNKNKQITEILAEIYLPVKDKLSSVLKHTDDVIEFSADLVESKDLADEIIDKINKRSKGRFYGVSNTRHIIDQLIRGSNFSEWDGFENFFNGLVKEIRSDYDELSNLLPKREKFYSFLTNMRYISAEYTLKLDGKTINELSAGERGLLLLVFYLALSKDSNPLIIDQPEDNLDNQSVYNRLVPCILEAKNNRQVIIVTHNPNIAVACDAEQIVFCDIDKTNMHITYSSGSIENTIIRNCIIDVLEGTKPAFDLRKSKYYFDLLNFRRENGD